MKSLSVPYFAQTDNWNNPMGSCNVTSVAMCLSYFKAKRNPKYKQWKQFEDELYSVCIDSSLDRHKPEHLAQLIKLYGCEDKFRYQCTINDVKRWIDSGNPCIVHGWFTDSGHIIVVVGYDNNGLIVHDPYGEWFEWGYDTNASGQYLHYSYRLIERTCHNDGQFWVHFVSGPKAVGCQA